jgi:hypothetical protein
LGEDAYEKMITDWTDVFVDLVKDEIKAIAGILAAAGGLKALATGGQSSWSPRRRFGAGTASWSGAGGSTVLTAGPPHGARVGSPIWGFRAWRSTSTRIERTVGGRPGRFGLRRDPPPADLPRSPNETRS